MRVDIRPALAADKEFILGLAPRLVEFGRVPGRDLSAMIDRDRAVLTEVLESPTEHAGIFVAVDEHGRKAGFIHLTTNDDYYSARDTAHVADVVVAPALARQGIGSALMRFAETWARDRGFELLTLNVFAENRAARDVYSMLGFHEEWIRCIKRV